MEWNVFEEVGFIRVLKEVVGFIEELKKKLFEKFNVYVKEMWIVKFKEVIFVVKKCLENVFLEYIFVILV